MTFFMASDIFRKLEAYPHEEFLSDTQGEALRWMMDSRRGKYSA